MTFRHWLKQFDMTKLDIDPTVLDQKWAPNDADRNAAWELYIELLTRVTTQILPDEDGKEVAALTSVYQLFPVSRDIMKRHGRECINFATVVIPVLNRVVRPFTAKWHPLSEKGAFEEKARRREFRAQLAELQKELRDFARLLANLAAVIDLTEKEKDKEKRGKPVK